MLKTTLPIAIITAAALTACGREEPMAAPPPPPPSNTGSQAATPNTQPAQPAAQPAGEDSHAGHVSVAELMWTQAETWVAVEPSSNMRAAVFNVPGGDGPDGEIVFFYFGPGQGGSVEANVQRWNGMVTDENGQPVEATIDQATINNIPVTTIDMVGTYAAGQPMGEKTPMPDWGFRGLIAEGPQGAVFIRFTGPNALVEANAQAWTAFTNSTNLH